MLAAHYMGESSSSDPEEARTHHTVHISSTTSSHEEEMMSSTADIVAPTFTQQPYRHQFVTSRKLVRHSPPASAIRVSSRYTSAVSQGPPMSARIRPQVGRTRNPLFDGKLRSRLLSAEKSPRASISALHKPAAMIVPSHEETVSAVVSRIDEPSQKDSSTSIQGVVPIPTVHKVPIPAVQRVETTSVETSSVKESEIITTTMQSPAVQIPTVIPPPAASPTLVSETQPQHSVRYIVRTLERMQPYIHTSPRPRQFMPGQTTLPPGPLIQGPFPYRVPTATQTAATQTSQPIPGPVPKLDSDFDSSTLIPRRSIYTQAKEQTTTERQQSQLQIPRQQSQLRQLQSPQRKQSQLQPSLLLQQSQLRSQVSERQVSRQIEPASERRITETSPQDLTCVVEESTFREEAAVILETVRSLDTLPPLGTMSAGEGGFSLRKKKRASRLCAC